MTACGGAAPITAVVAPPPADPARVVWQYEVRGNEDALSVEAQLAPGSGDDLRLDEGATRFVKDVTYASGEQWLAAPSKGGTWTVPCHAAGCRVRYRFELRAAATAIDDVETAVASGDVMVAPPSTWLLHPDESAGRLRMHVTVTPPTRFTAGMHPASGAPDTFEAAAKDLDDSSFAVIGPFNAGVVQSGKAHVDVAIAPRGLKLGTPEVVAWVRTAVDAIAAYLGRFPVKRALVVVQDGHSASPTRGETLGVSGPAVLIRAGHDVTAATTRDDWVMTHELLHVVLPTLSREHVWLGEGIPTYVEPIVRVRARLIAPEKFWGDLIDGLPQGLPEAGDKGLERTHTWGRTYWGGALFCLMADVAIRERTHGARSFDDVVRGVVATGNDVETSWDVERLLDVGDRATGTTVLADLYRTMARAPGTVDLPALWVRLGVRGRSTNVTFDDSAPLASVRKGIAGK